MASFKPGQRVKFFRLHDKATELLGVVVKEVKGLLHIKTDAGKGSVSRIEEAHPSDVRPLDDAKEAESETKPADTDPVTPAESAKE